MKEKEIRAAQLDDLKDGITPGTYCIEILNAAFQPWKTLRYKERADAERIYEHLSAAHGPAYVRKYAKFDF